MYAQSDATEVNLEREYSPSMCTKRFQDYADAQEQVLKNYLKINKEETDRVREKYQVKLDVRYGGQDDNQLLDIFYKEKEHGTPIFVFIHGGYWQELDKSTSGSFVAQFVEQNYRVLNVDYNLCPTVSLEQLCEQMWNFYEWLFKYAKETAAKSIAICGHSAGAHLIALLFEERALQFIDSLSIKISYYLIAGVYDLRELQDLPCVNKDNILGLNAATAERLSPLCWDLSVDIIRFNRTHDVTLHILVGKHESDTFVNQSRGLYLSWAKYGFKMFFKIFENYDHFNIIEEACRADTEIVNYLLKSLSE